jgi:hypothetical protein
MKDKEKNLPTDFSISRDLKKIEKDMKIVLKNLEGEINSIKKLEEFNRMSIDIKNLNIALSLLNAVRHIL